MTNPNPTPSDMGAAKYNALLADSNAYVFSLVAAQQQAQLAEQQRLDHEAAAERAEQRREATRQRVDEMERRSLENRHRAFTQVVKCDESIPAGSYLHQQISECCWRLIDQGADRVQLPSWAANPDDEHFRKSDAICFGITRGNVVTLQPGSRLFNPYNEGRVAKADHCSSDASEIQHILTHEALHGIRNARLGADAGRWFQWGDAERAIAKRVSSYAPESAAEFAAEVGTAMVFGRHFDPQVMALAKAVAAWTPPAAEPDGAPITLVDLKQVADGFKLTFSEPVSAETGSDPQNYVVLERHDIREYPELHDDQQYVSVRRVELAADGRSAVLIVPTRTVDDQGRKVLFQVYCPGLRPLTPAAPVPVGKAEGQQPITVHVHVPEQPAPVVHVAAPNVAPELKMPRRRKEVQVHRDKQGNITHTSEQEETLPDKG